tara:strand:+ start:185 stop:367 length:183 start_codon:yes stop_codon:yes gene_type:complete
MNELKIGDLVRQRETVCNISIETIGVITEIYGNTAKIHFVGHGSVRLFQFHLESIIAEEK